MIDISSILNGSSISTTFEGTVTFKEEDVSKIDVRSIENCTVKGTVTKMEDDVYSLNYTLHGTMILSDALTLEELPYKFKISDENDYEIGNYLKISENLLDIYEVLWENVVLEVPLRVVKDETHKELEGDGWSLNMKSEGNSGLSELKKLLDLEEEK